MNFSIVRYIIGYVLAFEAAFMALPCIVALIYQETDGWSFVITAILCLLFGAFLLRKKPKNQNLLCEGRFCNGSTQLDCPECDGMPAVFVYKNNYQSGGRPV